MAVWGGFTNSWGKKSEKQGRKRKIYLTNTEFQRIAKRDKMTFLNEQCKEVEENNRMEKIRDSQENWRYQGNISCKDGHDKRQKW